MGKSDAVHSECHDLMAVWIGGIRKDFKEWNSSNWNLENGEGFFVVVCSFFSFLFFKTYTYFRLFYHVKPEKNLRDNLIPCCLA